MDRRGLTILELVVVLAIIGLLAALLLPAIQAARESARRVQCASNVKSLVLGHHNYYDAHNHFPAEWAIGLRSLDHTGGMVSGPTPAEFQCPSNVNEIDMSGDGLTPYGHNVFLVGETIQKITDGSSNTVLQGEFIAQEGTGWVGSPGLTSINCTSAHVGGAHYGFADGSVHFLNENVAEEVRVYLIMPDDGKVITLPF